ncbi:phosphoglycerate mutase family protein [Deinococcus sp. HMF7604]|uniref:histidine phosphatase family protein n=1 Tax=Deinococcus betulae TaxID=2873312 RepID=UPI001CC9E309|nr:phosphoglycerate mutase family protein [Deinococcus betulae]
MQLLLIRHGQSSNNHREQTGGDLQGRLPDPPLTAVGHEQARRLAAWAAQDPWCARITHLYTSLTTRAVQTAAPLAEALGLEVQGLEHAYECGGLTTGPAGGFTPVLGRDHASLQTDCPALRWPAALEGQPWSGGAEPWDHGHFAQRAAQVATDLRRAAGEADVLALITHHDFAPFLLAELLGLPAARGEQLSFRLNNTATVRLELGTVAPGSALLHWLNRTDHLKPDLITL